jgi:hypothetical protein
LRQVLMEKKRKKERKKEDAMSISSFMTTQKWPVYKNAHQQWRCTPQQQYWMMRYMH